MNKLFFITSNRAKLMNARHLALQYNAQIHGKKYYGIAYREPRSLNRTELLQRSYEDALKRWIKTAGQGHRQSTSSHLCRKYLHGQTRE